MNLSGTKLIFFFDGSSNRAAGRTRVVPTNVFRLNQAFSNGNPKGSQVSFYFSGVGTKGARVDAATGRGFDDIVIEAYTNLASNYVEGDLVYLFGFSRGAAAARALSGLLSIAGLLKDTSLGFFPQIWEIFTSERTSVADKRSIIREMGPLFITPRPQISFLGAFDTVAGSSWDTHRLFSTTRFNDLELETCVRVAVQLLSLDESRKAFEPLVWHKAKHQSQTLEQIWMPGVHSDVGGSSDASFIGSVSLATMIERINHHCPELEFESTFLTELADEIDKINAMQITNEKAKWYMVPLPGKKRVVGRHPGEAYHPICDMLNARVFRIRGKKVRYRSLHATSSIKGVVAVIAITR